MALLTKKQFSELCKVTTSNLSNYIRRGKVRAENDLIDTTHDVNVSFLNKHSTKEVKPPPISQTQTPAIDAINFQALFPDVVPPLAVSEQLLKYRDTIKRQLEIERLQIDIDKKRGEVVPSELIQPIFLQHNQFILTEMKNFGDEWLRKYAKRHGLKIEEQAEMKGELVLKLNVAIQKAIQSSVSNIKNVINDFSIKKGVGERE